MDKHTVEGEEPVRLCNYTDVYYNERITPGITFMEASASRSEVQRFSIRDGDVLLTKDSETAGDIAVPAVVCGSYDGVLCGYHLAQVRPSPGILSGRYLARCIAAQGIRDQYRVSAQGVTRMGLTNSAVADSWIPVPPMDDQVRIADFLDESAARIDALVAKKERLIELLQEKRTALITRAVTQGLEPSVRTRESGIAWIGRVPTHWEAVRIKWVARMESGHTPDKKIEAYWANGDIPWISLNDSKFLKANDRIDDTKYKTNSLGIANSSARLLPAGAVVFSRDATIGLCAITGRPMAVSQHFIAWICGERLLPSFLIRVFDVMQQELDRLTMGATIKTIGMPDVRTLVTPLPPLREQEAIVEYIDGQRDKFDRLVAVVNRAIDRLKEYRTALISAAVTGKIDVRGEVAEPA